MMAVIGDIVHVPGDKICQPAVVTEVYYPNDVVDVVVLATSNSFWPKLNYFGQLQTFSGDDQPIENFYPHNTWHKPYECQLPQTTSKRG